MATGIKDKVAIIGMGCTRFGERWDAGAETNLYLDLDTRVSARAGYVQAESPLPGGAARLDRAGGECCRPTRTR